MFSLNKNKNKVIDITFVIVLCLMVITASNTSTPFSADVATGSKKAGSLSTSSSNGGTYCGIWISGSKNTAKYGVYGTKGVPNVASFPGARSGSVSWTDKDGNLWLFGGGGYAESGFSGSLNDLWRFNITLKEWTWMSGAKTIDQNGVYGTKGVSHIANYPGSRWGSVSWTDTDGNLWLFGGYGYDGSGSYGILNDLWRFNITSKEWAWMSGNKTDDEYGVYGAMRDPDIANYPGARYSSVSWTDTDGNLWLFGGYGRAGSGSWGRLNDLWRFNITSKEWAWMSGNNILNQIGVSGTKGVPDMANYPGARYSSVSWTDKNGSLWLFGGYGYAESISVGRLNDLWRFNITSNEWAWMSGSNFPIQIGVYGTKGVPDMANFPGSRTSSVSWMDIDGNLWLFGGGGYDGSGSYGVLNDLWRFNITSKEWAWMSGSKKTDEYGVYGAMRVPNCANYPGARGSSVSWTDTDGIFWLFGGYGYAQKGAEDYLNDLWRFKFGCACQIPSTGDDDDDDFDFKIDYDLDAIVLNYILKPVTFLFVYPILGSLAIIVYSQIKGYYKKKRLK